MPAAPMRPSNSIDGATRRLLPRSRRAIARCAACASSPSFKTLLRPRRLMRFGTGYRADCDVTCDSKIFVNSMNSLCFSGDESAFLPVEAV